MRRVGNHGIRRANADEQGRQQHDVDREPDHGSSAMLRGTGSMAPPSARVTRTAATAQTKSATSSVQTVSVSPVSRLRKNAALLERSRRTSRSSGTGEIQYASESGQRKRAPLGG